MMVVGEEDERIKPPRVTELEMCLAGNIHDIAHYQTCLGAIGA